MIRFIVFEHFRPNYVVTVSLTSAELWLFRVLRSLLRNHRVELFSLFVAAE